MATMKHGHSFALGLLTLALVACGGNGGGGGNSNDEPVGLTNTPRLEAILSDPSIDPEYQFQDPLSLQTGDQVRFQLVNYTGSGANVERHVLNAESFRTNDVNNVAGQLSSSTGNFAAATTDTGNRQYIVSARYQGVDYSSFYRINPRQIRLRGKVLAEGTGLPVYNATVDFYSLRNPLDPTSAQVRIATVHTAYDGTFRVSISAFNDDVDTVAEANEAAKIMFTVRSSELPSGFYSSFLFQGARYDAGSTVCRATLLSNDVVADPDTGETVYLPFKSGDRYLITEDSEAESNGTILLTPTSLYDSKPEADGCTSSDPTP